MRNRLEEKKQMRIQKLWMDNFSLGTC